MRRFRWPLLILGLCLPVGLLALDVRVPWFGRAANVVPKAVPPGDQEMAWLHTTTAAATWERFVSGLKRVEMHCPGLHVDDADAFLDQTYAVPEVVLRKDGHPGALRVRWYKLGSDATAAQWVAALAARETAPLALIGGASTDRALDLARALGDQTGWRGDRPLLFITMATADEVYGEDMGTDPPARGSPKLIDVYDDRTFRFCFTNRQMAEAVSDFVFRDPSLRPGPVAPPGLEAVPLAAASPWAGLAGLSGLRLRTVPTVFAVAWQDDPYSTDLSYQFRLWLHDRFRPPPGADDPAEWERPHVFESFVPFSVGSFSKPNRHEAELADEIARDIPGPGRRSLLVIPTVAPPARRLLRGLCEADPTIGRRLVAVTGDAISVNMIYRDGEFAWPVRALPVPLVMFTHHNPFGWDEPDGPAPPPGYALRPPTSTEDVLLYADLGRLAAEAAFPPPVPDSARFATTNGVINRADHLAVRLREHRPAIFDPEGNRLGGSGEYVVVLRPNPETGADRPDATIEVFRRGGDVKTWERVRTLPVTQRRGSYGEPDRAGRGG